MGSRVRSSRVGSGRVPSFASWLASVLGADSIDRCSGSGPRSNCRLAQAHPSREPHKQVSHETIYRSLFIQARGVLKKKL